MNFLFRYFRRRPRLALLIDGDQAKPGALPQLVRFFESKNYEVPVRRAYFGSRVTRDGKKWQDLVFSKESCEQSLLVKPVLPRKYSDNPKKKHPELVDKQLSIDAVSLAVGDGFAVAIVTRDKGFANVFELLAERPECPEQFVVTSPKLRPFFERNGAIFVNDRYPFDHDGHLAKLQTQSMRLRDLSAQIQREQQFFALRKASLPLAAVSREGCRLDVLELDEEVVESCKEDHHLLDRQGPRPGARTTAKSSQSSPQAPQEADCGLPEDRGTTRTSRVAVSPAWDRVYRRSRSLRWDGSKYKLFRRPLPGQQPQNPSTWSEGTPIMSEERTRKRSGERGDDAAVSEMKFRRPPGRQPQNPSIEISEKTEPRGRAREEDAGGGMVVVAGDEERPTGDRGRMPTGDEERPRSGQQNGRQGATGSTWLRKKKWAGGHSKAHKKRVVVLSHVDPLQTTRLSPKLSRKKPLWRKPFICRKSPKTSRVKQAAWSTKPSRRKANAGPRKRDQAKSLGAKRSRAARRRFAGSDAAWAALLRESAAKKNQKHGLRTA